jgi:hypothetical protein
MRITVAVEIDRPPEEVWADLSHIERHVDWMIDAAAIEFTSEQRRGVGVTFDTTTRIGPLTTTDRMRITEWDEGRVIGVRHEGVVVGEGWFVLAPRGDGATTHFEWTEELHLPRRFGGRVGELVAAPLLRAFWRRNLQRLQRRLESGPPAPPVGDPRPGPLVGAGRDTEVREYGPGWVIRAARDGRSLASERRVMQHAASAGYPVPALAPGDDGPAIVMERLDGPSMLDDLGRRPWRSGRHARTLARLHHLLGEIDGSVASRSVGTGNSLLHLDLHPGNVVLTARGPVVIDWANAARGDPELDVAKTWVLLKTAVPPGGPLVRAIAALLRDHFARRFLAHAGRPSAEAVLHAAELRLLDRNLPDGERDAVLAIARQHTPLPP